MVIDTAIMSVGERFEQLCHCSDVFSVIYDIKNLTKNKEDLNNSCKKLANALRKPQTKASGYTCSRSF